MSSTASSANPMEPKQLHTASPEEINKIKNIIKDLKFCMLTTQDDHGRLRSRPMGVSGELETVADGTELTFFTYKDSHKCTEMSQHQNQVCLAFADPKNQTYVSLSGTGRVSEDRGEMERRWSPLYKAWFPDGLNTRGIALLKVHLDAAEYWDSPSSTVAHAIAFVKSQLTGQVAKGIGQHEKVTLSDQPQVKEGRQWMGEQSAK